jgi:hypothetical protein
MHPDPTLFFSDFKDAKTVIFFHIFSKILLKSYFESIISEKGRIREAQKCADPADPDPQHYF